MTTTENHSKTLSKLEANRRTSRVSESFDQHIIFSRNLNSEVLILEHVLNAQSLKRDHLNIIYVEVVWVSSLDHPFNYGQ